MIIILVWHRPLFSRRKQNSRRKAQGHDLGPPKVGPLRGRLKRVFNIGVETCAQCGGSVKVIADTSDRCIEDQVVIDKILLHL